MKMIKPIRAKAGTMPVVSDSRATTARAEPEPGPLAQTPEQPQPEQSRIHLLYHHNCTHPGCNPYGVAFIARAITIPGIIAGAGATGSDGGAATARAKPEPGPLDQMAEQPQPGQSRSRGHWIRWRSSHSQGRAGNVPLYNTTLRYCKIITHDERAL